MANTSEKNGVLTLKNLIPMMVCAVVGAGVFGYMGSIIGLTGYSTWIAFVGAGVLTLFQIAPVIFISSATRLRGGEITLVNGTCSPVVAGMYSILFLQTPFSIGTLGISLKMYIEAIIPADWNANVVLFLVITLLVVINFFGVKWLARFQTVFTILLFIGCGLYVAFGLPNLTQPVFDFGDPNQFTGGASGLFSAMVLLTATVSGIKLCVSYSRDATNPQKNIPLAMLISMVIIVLIYALMAIVSVGVLPLGEVAGKTMTVQGQAIMPKAAYFLFLVGGPIIAIVTSLNSNLTTFRIPVERTCEVGFLPKSLARKNKYGVSWILLLVLYAFCLLPTFFNVPITTWLSNVMLLSSTSFLFLIYAFFRFPKKYPNLWNKAYLHIPNALYYVLCLLSLVVNIAIAWNTITRLKTSVVIISITVLVILLVYAYFRAKSGAVDLGDEVNLEEC